MRFSAGLVTTGSPALDGEVYAGGIYQRYVDPRFGTVFVPDFGGQVRWTGLPGTTVSSTLERTVQETDIQGASGYVQTEGSFQYHSTGSGRTSGSTAAFLRVGQIQRHDDRTDQVQSFGIGVRKYVTPHFYVGADFSRTTRDSSDPDYSYVDSRAMFRGGAGAGARLQGGRLQEARGADRCAGPLLRRTPDGVGNLETKLQGSRGANGTLRADFGDDTWASSVFGGYGVYLGNWYLALEADIGDASGGWDHSHVPEERVYSVERTWEYGLSGVIGRTFTGGTMLYGKAGVVAADSTPTISFNNRGTNDRRTQAGIRVGLGGTVPITPDFGVRMEHTYSAFSSYNIDCCIAPATGTPDNFTNDEAVNVFRAGLHLRWRAGCDDLGQHQLSGLLRRRPDRARRARRPG